MVAPGLAHPSPVQFPITWEVACIHAGGCRRYCRQAGATRTTGTGRLETGSWTFISRDIDGVLLTSACVLRAQVEPLWCMWVQRSRFPIIIIHSPSPLVSQGLHFFTSIRSSLSILLGLNSVVYLGASDFLLPASGISSKRWLIEPFSPSTCIGDLLGDSTVQ